MSNKKNRRILNRLHADALLPVLDSFSGLKEGLKSFLMKALKFWHRLLIISSLLILLLSGSITLKLISYYFRHYILKVYHCVNPHFEKPEPVFFHKYRLILHFPHLKQWKIANEHKSLVLVRYAREPRDPE